MSDSLVALRGKEKQRSWCGSLCLQKQRVGLRGRTVLKHTVARNIIAASIPELLYRKQRSLLSVRCMG